MEKGNIPEYPGYFLHQNGECWSYKTNRFLSVHVDSSRIYPYLALSKNCLTYKISVHRLLAYIYLDLPSLDSELEVDHIDTDILNYKLSNLQVLDKDQHLNKTLADRGMIKRDKRICETCNRVLSINNTTNTCRYCKSATKRKEDPSAEEIELLHRKLGSWDRAGKSLGISGNALRKRYKRMGRDPKQIKTRH